MLNWISECDGRGFVRGRGYESSFSCISLPGKMARVFAAARHDKYTFLSHASIGLNMLSHWQTTYSHSTLPRHAEQYKTHMQSVLAVASVDAKQEANTSHTQPTQNMNTCSWHNARRCMRGGLRGMSHMRTNPICAKRSTCQKPCSTPPRIHITVSKKLCEHNHIQV